jgi:hypothetical protein
MSLGDDIIAAISAGQHYRANELSLAHAQRQQKREDDLVRARARYGQDPSELTRLAPQEAYQIQEHQANAESKKIAQMEQLIKIDAQRTLRENQLHEAAISAIEQDPNSTPMVQQRLVDQGIDKNTAATFVPENITKIKQGVRMINDAYADPDFVLKIGQDAAFSMLGATSPADVIRSMRDGSLKKAKAEVFQRELQLRKAGAQSNMFVGSQQPMQPLPPGQRDEKFLATLPAGIAIQVKQMVDGKAQLPSGSSRSPNAQALREAVFRYDPGFDESLWQQRVTANKDFSAGGVAGQMLGAFNLAIQHADKLMKTIDKLDNAKYPAYNAVTNKAIEQSGDPRITAFNTTAHALVGEAGKIFRGSGQVTDQETKAMEAVLNPNGSKAQQVEATKTLVELMKSRVDVLQNRWENAFRGTKDFAFVTPEAQRVLNEKFIDNKEPRRVRITNGKQTGTVPEGTELDPGWSIIP